MGRFPAVVVLIVLSPGVFRAAPQDATAFKAALLSLIDAGASAFEAIKGEAGDDGLTKSWRSKISLPGARTCEIEEGLTPKDPLNVKCTIIDTDDEELGKVKYKDLLPLVAAALPNSWRYKDVPPYYDRAGKLFDMERVFIGPRNQMVTVQYVRIGYSSVMLNVSAIKANEHP